MTTDKTRLAALSIVRGRISEGVRHRLIMANAGMVEEIASDFRGAKGIPFEDLLSQGMLGLVQAANSAHRARDFTAYAAESIRNSIRRFISEWQVMTSGSPETMPEREFWEWSIWAYAAPYEQWQTVASTPEDIVSDFDELNSVRANFASAMIGLDPLARGIIAARFFRDPPQGLQSIAREYKISYAKTIWTIHRALKTIREKLESSIKKAV